MQVELTTLQPQLILTSEETAKMMVKIEAETREADAKKLLVQADEKEANAAAAVSQAIKVRAAERHRGSPHCRTCVAEPTLQGRHRMLRMGG